MTLIVEYPTKKVLKTQVGTELQFYDPSICGSQYKSTGKNYVTNSRRTWFAQVITKNDLIVKVN